MSDITDSFKPISVFDKIKEPEPNLEITKNDTFAESKEISTQTVENRQVLEPDNDLIEKIEQLIGNRETNSAADIIFSYVNKMITLNKKIVLSKEAVAIIGTIINNSPNILDDINTTITEIIKDGKIDYSDLPQIVVLVKKIYELIYKMKTVKIDSKKRVEISSEILKFVIRTLIKEKKLIPDEAIEHALLENLDKIVDSCVGLLNFSKTIKPSGCLSIIFGK